MIALVIFLGLIGSAFGACDAACQAYQWAYPIWHMGNLRFAQSAQWGLTPGQYAGVASQTFALNRFANKVATATPQPQPPAICTSGLCNGVPYVLNPNPIVSPNVDTLYKAAWLDLNAPQILNVPNPGARYYSILFFDMYTNVVRFIDVKSNPTGGRFCLIKIGDAVGAATCAQAAPTATVISLPHYGWALGRVYTSGATVNCPISQTAVAPGPDGCVELAQISLTALPGGALLDVFGGYKLLMAPVAASCGYLYGQPPCGTNGNKNLFWQAVCKLIVESPPSAAEAAYIDANFAQFGIHSTGCSAVDFVHLDQGLVDGYAAISTLSHTAGNSVPFGSWHSIPFNGYWGTTSADDYVLRAVTSNRLHAMNPNDMAQYFATFNDEDGSPLSAAANVTYQVMFTEDGAVPVDYAAHGFWSLTVYDSTYFLNAGANGHYAVRGATTAAPGTFFVSSNCVSANCIPAPATGTFMLLFRAYAPTSDLQPWKCDRDNNKNKSLCKTNYKLPKVRVCKEKNPCN